jgi:hypothetical protein
LLYLAKALRKNKEIKAIHVSFISNPFEFEPGELAPDQVEIKVTHCGICHSDLSMLDNEWGMSQFPLVPGHEAVGTVAALGENAQGSRSDSGFAWDGRLQSCLSQFWHTGRSSHASMTGGAPPGTASLNPAYWEDQTNVVSIPGGWLQPSPHRALTVGEIRAIVGEYREAAARAKAAGFDGAEIHSGNGYLLDQFLRTVATTAPTSTTGPFRIGPGCSLK